MHRVQTSEGTQWEDGVEGSYAWNHELTPAGTFFFSNGDEVDDIVLLPCLLPSSWVASWDRSSPFPARPDVVVGGDVVEGLSILCNAGGSVSVTEMPGRAVHRRAVLSCTLEEV